MGFVGGQELILILIIVVLLFGAKKILELAKGLGLGIKEFKKESKAIQDETTDKAESIQDRSSKNP